ncbi:MAG: helix-turn-helix transcriptional regulator [Novosphingobium sp.]
MLDPIIVSLVAATLGQVLLACLLLTQRRQVDPAAQVLAVLLATVGIAILPPVVAAIWPGCLSVAIALTLPAALCCGPLLWFYSCALTAEQAWQWQWQRVWHLLLPTLGLLIAVVAIALPRDLREALLLRGELVGGTSLALLVSVAFLLVLAWCAQTAIYLLMIYRQLARYRSRLKDLFASNDSRELWWLTVFAGIVGSVWLLAVASLLLDSFANRRLLDGREAAGLGFVLVTFLASWGLRQQPGFTSRYLPAQPDVPEPTAKYQRSALDQTRAERIAWKLKRAMTEDRLYLEPELSLFGLAERLGVPANYLSQTLNEHIGECFFDHINRWRVDAAIPDILAGDQSVLDVALAVGFNSRSTFYKAFRRATGQTPTAYRSRRAT